MQLPNILIAGFLFVLYRGKFWGDVKCDGPNDKTVAKHMTRRREECPTVFQAPAVLHL